MPTLYLVNNHRISWASLNGSVVKNPPAKAGDAGDGVQFLNWEESLEKEMATHSSTPAWETPRTEDLAGYNP